MRNCSLLLTLVFVGCGMRVRPSGHIASQLEDVPGRILRECDELAHPYSVDWTTCVSKLAASRDDEGQYATCRAVAGRAARTACLEAATIAETKLPEARCAESTASDRRDDRSLSTCLAAHGRDDAACIAVATGSKVECAMRLASCRSLDGVAWARCIDVGDKVGRAVVERCAARGGASGTDACIAAAREMDGIGMTPEKKAGVIDACFDRYAQMGQASPEACLARVKTEVLSWIVWDNDCYETKGTSREPKGPECFAAAREREVALVREPGPYETLSCAEPRVLALFDSRERCERDLFHMRKESVATCLALDDLEGRKECLSNYMEAFWWVMRPYNGPREVLEQRCAAWKAQFNADHQWCIDHLMSVDGWQLGHEDAAPESTSWPVALDPVVLKVCIGRQLDPTLCHSLDVAAESGDARRLIESCRGDTECLVRARSRHHNPVALVAACRRHSHDDTQDFHECLEALGDRLPAVTLRPPGFTGNRL